MTTNRAKSIVDLGIEIWDDVFMCHAIGLPTPSIHIRPRDPFTNEELRGVFGGIKSIVEYWRERARLKGYAFPGDIEEINMTIKRRTI